MTDKSLNRIEERLQSLPKPSLSHESKESIRSHLIETIELEKPMKRRYRTSKKLFFNLAGVAVFALLAFFIFNSIQENNPITTSKAPLTTAESNFYIQGKSYELGDHKEYSGTFIGDNSAVIAILEGLPGATYRQSIELKTKDQPFGLAVNYGPNNADTTNYDEYWADDNRTLLYNATVLFMVIDNVDYIDFYVEKTDVDHTYITRSQIEKLYGRDVKTYIGEPELWNQEVLDILNDDVIVNQYLTQ